MSAIVPDVSTTFVTLCKKAYRPLANDNDEVPIQNVGALRLGLQALLKEDSDDNDRAKDYWAEAKALLITEQENLYGPGSEGTVQLDDSFEMEHVADEFDGYCGFGFGFR